MKVINLKCPECNANIEINSDLNQCFCQYCGARVTIEDENETKTERVIKILGNELQKSREYYSSDKYKERLKIQHEETMKSLKFVGIIFGILILMMILIGVLFGNSEEIIKDDMTCTMDNKEYIIVLEKGVGLSCASCEQTMMDLFNEKYVDLEDIKLSKKNIRTYFINNNGSCSG